MTVPLDAMSAPAHAPRPLGNDARPARTMGVGRDGSPALAHPRLVLAATAVMSLGVVVPVPSLRALLVLPVALLAPGYALLMALFGDARRTGLDPVPFLALSVLLSLACYPLLALLLHLAALPIATGTVVGATDTTIMLLLAGSSWRSSQHSPAMAAPRVGAPPDVATGGAREGPHGVIRFAVIVSAAGLILAATLRLLPAPADAPYTMLYLAGRSAYLAGPVEARGYRAAGSWERCAARAQAARLAVPAAATGAVGTVDLSIGVTNGTARRRSYHVVPLLDGVPCWRGRTLLLGPGTSWSGHVGGAVPADGALHRLTITLRQPGQPGGGGQDRAGSVGSLVVWVRGAPPPGVTHRGPRQSSRPRQDSHRRVGGRLIRHHIQSAGRPPTRHDLITGSAPVRRARLYAVARSPARQGLVTGSAGGPPAWYRLHDGWGHQPARWRRKRAGRPRSRLSVCATSCATATLRRKRPGGPYSQPDHASTTMHQPRLRSRPSPRR